MYFIKTGRKATINLPLILQKLKYSVYPIVSIFIVFYLTLSHTMPLHYTSSKNLVLFVKLLSGIELPQHWYVHKVLLQV